VVSVAVWVRLVAVVTRSDLRSGGTIAPGFEGGQQPLHRRLPKFGFVSLKAMDRAEVRLSELAKVEGDIVILCSPERCQRDQRTYSV
jgi:hypothetical protein